MFRINLLMVAVAAVVAVIGSAVAVAVHLDK